MTDKCTPVNTNKDLSVLALPYGGPVNGKDLDGQFFSKDTNFLDGFITSPPVFYTHGTANDFEPEPIGTVTSRWYDEAGGWMGVLLDKTSPRYEQVMSAYRTGNLRASTGVVPASYDYDKATGHITSWLVGELSLVDLRDGYVPVNAYAVAKSTVLFDNGYGDEVMAHENIGSFLNKIISWAKNIHTAAEEYAEGVEEEREEAREELVDVAEERLPPVPNPDATLDPNLYSKAEESSEDMSEEKCASCDEAKKLADELRAEIAGSAKCARCPEAVQWVKAVFKAGKIAPKEVFEFLDEFEKTDLRFDEIKAMVEDRQLIPAKAELFVAGGTKSIQDHDKIFTDGSDVDNDYLNKLRKFTGLPTK